MEDRSGTLLEEEATLAEEQIQTPGTEQLRGEMLVHLCRADRMRMLGRLTAGVVHDLGTPLNVVVGRARMIESGELVGDQVTRSAQVIAEQADRMTASMRRLMEYTRASGGLRDSVRLGALLDDILALLAPMLRRARVQVDVGPEVAATNLIGAHVELQQVLANLLVNAIDAMPQGGKVAVTSRPAHGETAAAFVRVAVRDEGAGIAADILPRIFEPFFTTRDEEGAGIGLTVCEALVAELGGWIEVESLPGEGARFELHLPGEVRA